MNANTRIIINILLILISLLALSCGTSDKTVGLKYRDSGKVRNYHIQYTDKIALDMGGQPMNAEKEFGITYSELPSSNNNQQNIDYTITLKEVSASITMAQGRQVIDTRNMINRTIEMFRSPTGDSMIVADDKIIPKINMSEMAGGPVGIDYFLKSYNPVLPSKLVKKGDSWTAWSTRNQIVGSLPVNGLIETTHRLVSFEKVHGYECIKIESQSTGKLSGDAEQMGMHWTHQGTFESKTIWYFAYSEGLLVQASFTEHTKGTLDATGENAMSVPVEHNTIVELELLED